ncbi:hypothetical protein BDY24DRAFT_444501 [Mrakia frigida]|uniref:uncharacterized protein n=1 Tax=Mrakia frigida TaxID=29902 RepID=UPI003FCC181F
MFIPTSLLALVLSTSLLVLADSTTHRVYVGVDDHGNPALQYSPSELHAEVGDVVEFHFKPKAHSVTQGSFDHPCVKAAKDAFDTQLVPVDHQQSLIWSQETFRTLEVTSKHPQVFYCKQQLPQPHCGQGMVFVLNPYGDKNIEAVKHLAIAQNGTVPPNSALIPPPTSTVSSHVASPTAAIHEVQVGPNGKFVYDPPYVHANKGDVVRFKFNPKNHTVTESSFTNPCRRKNGGFDSGFRFVAANATGDQQTFDVVVGDPSIPQIGYCRQGLGTEQSHCERLGPMVFAINPAKEGPYSLDALQKTALATVLGSAPLPEPEAKVHEVQVGPNGKFVYDPPSIVAAKGDIVRFKFNPKNHTVTESTFTNPCRRKSGGFDSDFRFVAANATGAQQNFDVVVGDPAVPQFGYCRQGLGTDNSHCERLGPMVFAINPAKDGPQSLESIQKVALATVLGSAPLAEPSTGSSSMNVTLAAGGAAAAFASIGGAVFFYIRRRSLRKRGSYGQIDETTAPLGDRSDIGEFTIPLKESRSMSPLPPTANESRIIEEGGGRRPLLASDSSA